MRMTIYRVIPDDGKWHLYNFDRKEADCGKEIGESIIIGQGTAECVADPPLDTLCPKCWEFIR